MTLPDADPALLTGTPLFSADGDDIGRIHEVFLDTTDGTPRWFTVHVGFLGLAERFVPAWEAARTHDGIQVPYSEDRVKDAPNVDVDAGHLTPEQESRLLSYYTDGPAVVAEETQEGELS